MSLIELKKVSKVFGNGTKTVALKNINLAIQEGEFLAIMGPSGSGKSTLMNIIGLLEVPSEGQYVLEGKPVGRRKDRELARLRREKIGFVFQNFNLIPRLNLLQNIELPMIYRGLGVKKRRQQALELLSRVGLGERTKHKPNKISGGEMQRAAIARALANQPSLILADEPTGNLDSKNSELIIGELVKLNRQGTTVVVITHNPEIAAKASRTVQLRDGQVAGGVRPASGPRKRVQL